MKHKKEKTGFTLVEMMVTVAIFALGFIAIAAIYVGISTAQKRAKNSVENLNEAQLVFEQVARQVRDLTLDQNATSCSDACAAPDIDVAANSYICLKDLANGKTYLRFHPVTNGTGYVEMNRSNNCADANSWVRLSDPAMDVLDLKFYVKYPSETVPEEQPLTTITMLVKSLNARTNDPALRLQTAVSSRMYVGRDFQASNLGTTP